uniref:Uncharacterized protein n=1 Tax=Oryza punctata TaxID=4537 RepID=A0A0E0M3F8_ORYPU
MTTPVWGTSIFLPLVASASVTTRQSHQPCIACVRANGCTIRSLSTSTKHLMAPLTPQSTAAAMIARPPPSPAKNSVTLLPPGAKCSGGGRRAFLRGVIAAGACSLLLGGDGGGIASAASKRRAPPPPVAPEERKDPSVSGLQAKVMASKKRKEAMKEFVAKMREKGKPVNN